VAGSIDTMASPNVLLSSAAFFGRPLASTFRLAAETGYRGVEVMVTKDPDSQDPRRVRALSEEFGLEVGALHAPCLLLTRRVWGADPVGKIERSVWAAEDAGIALVVVHPPYRWQRAFRRWMLDDLPWIEQRTGVAVAVENMFPLRVAGRGLTFHSNQDLEQLEGMHHLALDTSHAAVAGHDPIDLRRRFGERLRHVHLSDNAGRGWDSHLPPGRGVLDLEGFLRSLGPTYDGAVSLEVDLRNGFGEERRLLSTMTEMRRFVEGALGVGRADPSLAG
jgi:sugar phosphate isomerase/epimerase